MSVVRTPVLDRSSVLTGHLEATDIAHLVAGSIAAGRSGSLAVSHNFKCSSLATGPFVIRAARYIGFGLYRSMPYGE